MRTEHDASLAHGSTILSGSIPDALNIMEVESRMEREPLC